LPDGEQQRARDDALTGSGVEAIAAFDWIYGHDAVAMAAASSPPA